jgi:hypothetical protein
MIYNLIGELLFSERGNYHDMCITRQTTSQDAELNPVGEAARKTGQNFARKIEYMIFSERSDICQWEQSQP